MAISKFRYFLGFLCLYTIYFSRDVICLKRCKSSISRHGVLMPSRRCLMDLTKFRTQVANRIWRPFYFGSVRPTELTFFDGEFRYSFPDNDTSLIKAFSGALPNGTCVDETTLPGNEDGFPPYDVISKKAEFLADSFSHLVFLKSDPADRYLVSVECFLPMPVKRCPVERTVVILYVLDLRPDSVPLHRALKDIRLATCLTLDFVSGNFRFQFNFGEQSGNAAGSLALVIWQMMTAGDTGRDVDKGYAWVILAGCYVTYLLIIGSIKTYGILYTEFDEYYDVGSGPVAIIGSLLIGIMFALAPFANYLAVKTSFRLTTFAGGLLLGIGYVSSCFVSRLEYLFLTLGLVTGIGFGLIFAPCSTIISFYFEKRRSFANGVTVSASGIGAIGFSFLYKYLFETYALKPSLMIVGGILFNVCVAASLFRQPESLLRQKKLESQKKSEKIKIKEHSSNGELLLTNHVGVEDQERKKCSCGPEFKLTLFKNPRFALYALAFMICTSGYGNNLILIPSQIKKLGFGKSSISTSVAITGGTEVVGRILVGWIADQKWIPSKYIFSFNFIISSVFAAITPHIDSLPYLFVYSAVIGTFPASFWSLMPVLVIDVVGLKDFPAAYGLILPCLAVGLSVSHTFIAWLKDKTGDWTASFYITAALLLLPAILMLTEPLLVPRKYLIPSENAPTDKSSAEGPHPNKPHADTNHTEDSALLNEETDIGITPHRPSKIYKAYNKELAESNSIHGVTAPLAKLENI